MYAKFNSEIIKPLLLFPNFAYLWYFWHKNISLTNYLFARPTQKMKNKMAANRHKDWGKKI
jgi:hypothetical protein